MMDTARKWESVDSVGSLIRVAAEMAEAAEVVITRREGHSWGCAVWAEARLPDGSRVPMSAVVYTAPVGGLKRYQLAEIEATGYVIVPGEVSDRMEAGAEFSEALARSANEMFQIGPLKRTIVGVVTVVVWNRLEDMIGSERSFWEKNRS